MSYLIVYCCEVGYSSVADFMVQSETTDQIAEALKVLRPWNVESVATSIFYD